uniref:HECT-type E3 ubiquitin transferase n=1 Tax=Salmo trutta TaxID=8032 RepID=A0A674EZ62_SALTR
MVKRAIIQRDSEQQMISMARVRHTALNMNLLFLNIKVRRAQLLNDSLDELSRKKVDLKKKLKVTFIGEAGLDMGGLTKEWFLLLLQQIIHTDYGETYSWKYTGPALVKTDHLKRSKLSVNQCIVLNSVCQLIGLAVYNSICLDIHFPPYCYNKLLTPHIVPCDQNTHVCQFVSYDCFISSTPFRDLAHGLGELLSYEGNVEEDFYLTFQVFVLLQGAWFNKQNRKEYVQLYTDFLLKKSIYKQFAAFYHGFHSVCMQLLRPEEVEILVCGTPELGMSALQKAAQYEGYSKSDLTVRHFWDVVLAFPLELQKKLLHFATGCDRVPVGGLVDLNFKIAKIDVSTDWLPISHTCFNQICLPPYKSRKELKQKLTISNAEGFGLE